MEFISLRDVIRSYVRDQDQNCPNDRADNSRSPFNGYNVHENNDEEMKVFKFLGSVVGIIFIIGLLVVIGILMLIF